MSSIKLSPPVRLTVSPSHSESSSSSSSTQSTVTPPSQPPSRPSSSPGSQTSSQPCSQPTSPSRPGRNPSLARKISDVFRPLLKKKLFAKGAGVGHSVRPTDAVEPPQNFAKPLLSTLSANGNAAANKTIRQKSATGQTFQQDDDVTRSWSRDVIDHVIYVERPDEGDGARTRLERRVERIRDVALDDVSTLRRHRSDCGDRRIEVVYVDFEDHRRRRSKGSLKYERSPSPREQVRDQQRTLVNIEGHRSNMERDKNDEKLEKSGWWSDDGWRLGDNACTSRGSDIGTHEAWAERDMISEVVSVLELDTLVTSSDSKATEWHETQESCDPLPHTQQENQRELRTMNDYIERQSQLNVDQQREKERQQHEKSDIYLPPQPTPATKSLLHETLDAPSHETKIFEILPGNAPSSQENIGAVKGPAKRRLYRSQTVKGREASHRYLFPSGRYPKLTSHDPAFIPYDDYFNDVTVSNTNKNSTEEASMVKSDVMPLTRSVSVIQRGERVSQSSPALTRNVNIVRDSLEPREFPAPNDSSDAEAINGQSRLVPAEQRTNTEKSEKIRIVGPSLDELEPEKDSGTRRQRRIIKGASDRVAEAAEFPDSERKDNYFVNDRNLTAQSSSRHAEESTSQSHVGKYRKNQAYYSADNGRERGNEKATSHFRVISNQNRRTVSSTPPPPATRLSVWRSHANSSHATNEQNAAIKHAQLVNSSATSDFSLNSARSESELNVVRVRWRKGDGSGGGKREAAGSVEGRRGGRSVTRSLGKEAGEPLRRALSREWEYTCVITKCETITTIKPRLVTSSADLNQSESEKASMETPISNEKNSRIIDSEAVSCEENENLPPSTDNVLEEGDASGEKQRVQDESSEKSREDTTSSLPAHILQASDQASGRYPLEKFFSILSSDSDPFDKSVTEEFSSNLSGSSDGKDDDSGVTKLFLTDCAVNSESGSDAVSQYFSDPEIDVEICCAVGRSITKDTDYVHGNGARNDVISRDNSGQLRLSHSLDLPRDSNFSDDIARIDLRQSCSANLKADHFNHRICETEVPDEYLSQNVNSDFTGVFNPNSVSADLSNAKSDIAESNDLSANVGHHVDTKEENSSQINTAALGDRSSHNEDDLNVEKSKHSNDDFVSQTSSQSTSSDFAFAIWNDILNYNRRSYTSSHSSSEEMMSEKSPNRDEREETNSIRYDSRTDSDQLKNSNAADQNRFADSSLNYKSPTRPADNLLNSTEELSKSSSDEIHSLESPKNLYSVQHYDWSDDRKVCPQRYLQVEGMNSASEECIQNDCLDGTRQRDQYNFSDLFEIDRFAAPSLNNDTHVLSSHPSTPEVSVSCVDSQIFDADQKHWLSTESSDSDDSSAVSQQSQCEIFFRNARAPKTQEIQNKSDDTRSMKPIGHAFYNADHETRSDIDEGVAVTEKNQTRVRAALNDNDHTCAGDHFAHRANAIDVHSQTICALNALISDDGTRDETHLDLTNKIISDDGKCTVISACLPGTGEMECEVYNVNRPNSLYMTATEGHLNYLKDDRPTQTNLLPTDVDRKFEDLGSTVDEKPVWVERSSFEYFDVPDGEMVFYDHMELVADRNCWQTKSIDGSCYKEPEKLEGHRSSSFYKANFHGSQQNLQYHEILTDDAMQSRNGQEGSDLDLLESYDSAIQEALLDKRKKFIQASNPAIFHTPYGGEESLKMMLHKQESNPNSNDQLSTKPTYDTSTTYKEISSDADREHIIFHMIDMVSDVERGSAPRNCMPDAIDLDSIPEQSASQLDDPGTEKSVQEDNSTEEHQDAARSVTDNEGTFLSVLQRAFGRHIPTAMFHPFEFETESESQNKPDYNNAAGNENSLLTATPRELHESVDFPYLLEDGGSSVDPIDFLIPDDRLNANTPLEIRPTSSSERREIHSRPSELDSISSQCARSADWPAAAEITGEARPLAPSRGHRKHTVRFADETNLFNIAMAAGGAARQESIADGAGYSVTVHDYAELHWARERSDVGPGMKALPLSPLSDGRLVRWRAPRGNELQLSPSSTWTWGFGNWPQDGNVSVLHTREVVSCQSTAIKPVVDKFVVITEL